MLESTLKINLKVLKVFKMVTALVFLMHILGCFWFYIAVNGDYETNWLAEYDDGSGLDKPPSIQYLYSVYWSLMTLTTVGYGDITPTNDLERLYALASLLIGALVFGYMVSSVGSLIDNLDNRSNMVDEKLSQMQEVILHSALPADLASRIRSYTEYYYSKQSIYDPKEVLSHLTPALNREIKDVFLSQSVDLIPLMRVHAKAFKTEVLGALRPAFKEESEQIIGKGSRCEDLFFLRKGEVHGLSSARRLMIDLTETGRFFDEHSFLSRSCPFTYIAFTRCEMYTMPISALLATMRAHMPRNEQERLRHDVIKVMPRHWQPTTLTSGHWLSPRTLPSPCSPAPLLSPCSPSMFPTTS